ncbi:MAG: hypothetical protein Q9M91_06515 [Candidatus Dojkabacteria bacterium]|nr:hypothetical protein [Candidatus Dojkabacteria bacterium]
MIFQTLSSYNEKALPVAEEKFSYWVPADRLYGEISVPQIPSLQYNKSTPIIRQNFHLAFPDTAYVYAVEKPREKLDTFDNARDTISILGFSPDNFTELIPATEYLWGKDNSTKQITFNTSTRKWR